MAKLLDSSIGKLRLLGRNPRTMSADAFAKLCDSIRRDTDFLMCRGLVVWSDENIVIGGNQRYRALQEIGLENLATPVTKIPDSWICLAKHLDGSWWTEEEVDRFILLDNNPDGISGMFDYEKMVEEFNREAMAMAGIDFSLLPEDAQADAFGDGGNGGSGSGDGDGNGDGGGAGDGLQGSGKADEVERGANGQQDPALQKFIADREKSRSIMGEMMDVGFYRVLVFENAEQALMWDDFCAEKGVEEMPRRGMFYNGYDVADKMGLKMGHTGLHFPDVKPTKALADMAMENDQEPADHGIGALADAGFDYDAKLREGLMQDLESGEATTVGSEQDLLEDANELENLP